MYHNFKNPIFDWVLTLSTSRYNIFFSFFRMHRRQTVSKRRSTVGGAAFGGTADLVGDINCDSETGLDLMICQFRLRLLQICQCIVNIVNVADHSQKLGRICLTEGVVLKNDVRPLEKRIKDAYEMLKGMVDKLPGNPENFDDPNFVTRLTMSSLTATYSHFNKLIEYMKPLMAIENPILSDEYTHYLKLVKEVVNKLDGEFRASLSEEQVASRQMSRQAAEFHEEERESLRVMKHLINTQAWHKAEQKVSAMRSSLEERRSQLPSGGPPRAPGAPGLMGQVVTPPVMVPAYIPNAPTSSWAQATPPRRAREARVAEPAGGRRKTHRRRY